MPLTRAEDAVVSLLLEAAAMWCRRILAYDEVGAALLALVKYGRVGLTATTPPLAWPVPILKRR